jgi:di/tricarboxylate transporter
LTFDQAVVFAIIAGLMVLFVSEKVRYDLAALLGLLAAVGTGIVSVDKAFGGFGDQVVIIVASALIISAGVSKSGVIARLIRRGEPYMRTPGTQVFILATSVALLSSFMKNIGALAIFLPVALQIARRSGTSGSTLLMPMAFASLIGGVVTLVGTSPNILVSRIRQEVLGKPFEMFDFAPVGLGILVAGLGFLAFGWRLLPASLGAQASAQDAFQVDAYIIEASVPASSPFVDKTVESLEALGDGEVSVIAIIREGVATSLPATGGFLRTTCSCCRVMPMRCGSSRRRRGSMWSARQRRPTRRSLPRRSASWRLLLWPTRSLLAARLQTCGCATDSG